MRTTVTLAVIAAALAVPTTLELIKDRRVFTAIDTVPRLFPGFTPDNIRFVQFSRAKPVEPGAANKAEPEREVVTVARTDKGWALLGNGDLNGAPVQKRLIEDDVLARVAEMRRDPKSLYKAQATAEDLEQAGLTRDTATLIECFDASRKAMAELYVGKDASRGKGGPDAVRGWFVRRRGGAEDTGPKDIVLYESDPHMWDLSVRPERWIDRIVHDFEFDEVQAVSIRNEKGQAAFEKNDKDAWVAVDAPAGTGAVRVGEVDLMFSQFSMLQVNRFIEPLAKHQGKLAQLGLEKGKFEIAAKMRDGTQHRLLIGLRIPGQNERYARTDDSPFLLAVGEWMISAYEKDPKELFDPPADAVPKDGGANDKGK